MEARSGIQENSFEHVLAAAAHARLNSDGLMDSERRKVSVAFLEKNTQAAISIKNLLTAEYPGIERREGDHDYASVGVLIRSLFEGCIKMHYLLRPIEDQDEAALQWDRWEAHKWQEILKMGKALEIVDPRFDGVRMALEKTLSRIESNPGFSRRSKEHRREILKCASWTEASVSEMARVCGFHATWADYIYRLMSSYYLTHNIGYAFGEKKGAHEGRVVLDILEVPLDAAA